MAHNDNTDLFFFPVVVNGRKMILGVRASVPYIHEEIVNKVREYVGKLRTKISSRLLEQRQTQGGSRAIEGAEYYSY